MCSCWSLPADRGRSRTTSYGSVTGFISGLLSAMLLQAFHEGVTPGPGGYVDDNLSLVASWGFTLDQVKATDPDPALHARTRPCRGNTPNGRPRTSQTRSLSGWKAVISQTTRNLRNARVGRVPEGSPIPAVPVLAGLVQDDPRRWPAPRRRE